MAPTRKGLPIHGYRWNCSKRPPAPAPPPSPPLVAHCAAGLMRSFLEPVIHRSYLHNLVHGLGGRAALFLQLKTFDVQRKRNRKMQPCLGMGCTFPTSAEEDIVPNAFDATARAKVAAAMQYLQPQAAILLHVESPQYNPRCYMGHGSNGSVVDAYKSAAGVIRGSSRSRMPSTTRWP